MVGALKSSAGYMASRQYAYLKFIRKRKTRMKNQVYIRRGRRNLLCGLDFFLPLAPNLIQPGDGVLER
jgi:hypothetical protein